MKTSVKLLISIIFLILAFYVCLPVPEYPEHPKGVLQSTEAADLESPFRQSYFTNLTREEIMTFYTQKFNRPKFLNLWIPTYRLNYPPEESQSIIRDQTHSTFLEEIVHPFRESLFISGYEPDPNYETLTVEGQIWRQKIIVKYVPSLLWARLLVIALAFIFTWVIKMEWLTELGKMLGRLKGKKI
jgi:hypothetical protein